MDDVIQPELAALLFVPEVAVAEVVSETGAEPEAVLALLAEVVNVDTTGVELCFSRSVASSSNEVSSEDPVEGTGDEGEDREGEAKEDEVDEANPLLRFPLFVAAFEAIPVSENALELSPLSRGSFEVDDGIPLTTTAPVGGMAEEGVTLGLRHLRDGGDDRVLGEGRRAPMGDIAL